MTISLNAKTTHANATVFHQEQHGEKGFILNIGGGSVFLPVHEALRLADYINSLPEVHE